MTLIIRMLLALVGILGTVTTASCAATVYAPTGDYAGFPHGGYDDEKIKDNTAIVSFSGNKYTSQRIVRTYMLYRCAQVTLQNGYDFFVIVSSTNQSCRMRLKTHDSYRLVDNPPRMYDSYYKVSTVSSYDFVPSSVPGYNHSMEECAPGAVSTIKMFRGEPPKGLPNAYVATDVISRLGPATF